MEKEMKTHNCESASEQANQKHVKKITKQTIFEFLKFVGFSISAGVIQVVLFTILNEFLHISYWIAYLPSLIASVFFNFTFNRKFTFHSSNNIPLAMFKVLCFYAVFTPLSTFWGNALENIGWNEYIILGGTMLINFITEYLYSKFFVFNPKFDIASTKNKDKLDK